MTYVSAPEAARILGISRQRLHQLILAVFAINPVKVTAQHRKLAAYKNEKASNPNVR